jgi:FAD/FMN-containing dehydrogenase
VTAEPALLPITTELIDQLRAIVGDGGIVGGNALANRYPGYFMERIGADFIVRPRTTDEVAAILRLCNDAGQPIVVHGGMSGWVRATETKAGEIALSMERMSAIETIDPVNRTATVQAGVVLETLQTKLNDYGLTFPLDLGGRGSCQLGGNASTNAGGMRVIRYGMMREQVLGVEAVLADGRIISSLNQMIKNNTGYDLKQLFIGSEGTLGVITRLVLRLRERPSSVNTAIVCAQNFDQMVSLLRHVDHGFGGLLSAFELIDKNFYAINTGADKYAAPLPGDKPYYAIIEMLGSHQERDAHLFETVLSEAAEHRYFDDAVLASSEAQRQQIWSIREDLEHVTREFKPFYAFDVSLPVGNMHAYICAVTDRLKARWPDGKIAFLGHMGDGNLHIAIGAGSADDRHGIEECVYEPLRPIGGSISAEHGIGLEKKPWLDVSRSHEERGLMQELKQLLDPKNILNPGKIMDARP